MRRTGDTAKMLLASLFSSVGGTHSYKYTAWLFPNPSTHTKCHFLDYISFDRICHQFEIVCKHLEHALVGDVYTIATNLQKPEYVSDSVVCLAVMVEVAI
jgi:hypothetical protein